MNQKGFTLIELAIAVGIVALIGGGAAITVFHIIPGVERSNSHIVAASQVQDAGYWISYDGQMAESVITELEAPDLLIVTWTERDYEHGNNIYHSVTYSLQDLNGNVGRLKRTHWSSGGANEQMIVADHIYYNPEDNQNTSRAHYQNRVLTLQLTSSLGDTSQTKEYRITRRPNF